MRSALIILTLAALTTSGCQKKTSERPLILEKVEMVAAATTPRFTFIRGQEGTFTLYRCNNYTGQVDMIGLAGEPGSRKPYAIPLAPGDSVEESSLVDTLRPK